jgi:hypothetical protein
MLKTLLEHSDWRVRAMALRGMLAADQTQENDAYDMTLNAAGSMLDDSSWQVRAAAVDVLVRTWRK